MKTTITVNEFNTELQNKLTALQAIEDKKVIEQNNISTQLVRSVIQVLDSGDVSTNLYRQIDHNIRSLSYVLNPKYRNNRFATNVLVPLHIVKDEPKRVFSQQEYDARLGALKSTLNGLKDIGYFTTMSPNDIKDTNDRLSNKGYFIDMITQEHKSKRYNINADITIIRKQKRNVINLLEKAACIKTKTIEVDDVELTILATVDSTIKRLTTQ